MKRWLCTTSVLLSVMLVLMCTTQAGAANPQPKVTAKVAAEARTVVMDALPQAPEVAPGNFKEALKPGNPLPDALYQQKLNQVKAAAVGRAEAAGAAGPKELGSGPRVPGTKKNFNGINENCAGYTPSDMGLAVGGSYVVQAVNSCIAVYNKSGVLYSGYPKQTWAFLGYGSNTYTTDPRITYDYAKNRFILVVLSYDSNGWEWNLAVTAGPNPTGGWYIYRVGYGSTTPDYPTLGFDRTTILSGVNALDSNHNF